MFQVLLLLQLAGNGHVQVTFVTASSTIELVEMQPISDLESTSYLHLGAELVEMYKLLGSTLLLQPGEVVKAECVLRVADNTFIPFDEANTDYQEYLAWVADGNTAEAAD